jgi:DNA polymerase III sliding clamp (beta) subunit (PCNA family)
MTKVVFETATLADVMKKCNIIAPSRGEAFDKAAGFLITVMRDSDQVMIQATNLEIFYTEWISTVSVTLPDGVDEAKWRVPSRSTAAIVGSFPIGSGREVTLEQQVGTKTLRIMSGRARGSFQLIDASQYPEWAIFDPDDLIEVEDFGGRLAQVDWACSDDPESSFNGVNLTGEWAQACDRYRAARVPLKVDAATAWPFAETVTVPSRILSQLMKQTGSVSLGCTPNELLVMPNEHVQVRARLFGLPYMSLDRIVSQQYVHTIDVRKAALLEILNRVMLMAGSDRLPSMKLFVGKGEIAAMMEDAEEGVLGDIVEVPGYANHERTTITFTPKNLIEAIDKCPSERLTFSYDPTDPLRIVKVDDGAGYEAWVMTRRPQAPSQEA